jgi:hypothetical protein
MSRQVKVQALGGIKDLFLELKPLVDAMIAQFPLEKYLCCGAYGPQAAIITSGESEGKAEATWTYHLRAS